MMDFVIKTVTPKSGVMRSIHEEVLGRKCRILDVQVGLRGWLELEWPDPYVLHTSIVLGIKRAEDDSWVEIETKNTFYRLEKLKEESGSGLEKYIVVKTINVALDACATTHGKGHPCGVCMCSDNNGEPLFTFIESGLIDTYKEAKAIADKTARSMADDIAENVNDGWILHLSSSGLCSCFRNKPMEDYGAEDYTWLFKVDIHKVKVDKK